MHERSTKVKFPGFLEPEDLHMIMARNGIRLSHHDCRHLAFAVAPEKNGRINQQDLQAFSKSTCRSFGEILVLLERDIMEPATTFYKIHRDYIRKNGVEDPEHAAEFEGVMKECIDAVKRASSGAVEKKGTGVSLEIVSIPQIKNGIEKAFEGFKTPAPLLVSMEEWTLLAIRTGDAIVDSSAFGVKISQFIHNICYQIAGKIESSNSNDSMPLEMFCRDLQIMLREEAKQACKGKKKIDYTSAFNLFDLDGTGTIDTEEFKKMLIRLRMVDGISESNFPKLMAEFDKSKKGYITIEDFTAFAENPNFGYMEKSIDDDDINDDYGIASNTPPVAISRNADTDWLLWFLWKEAFKQDKADPEGVITELEASCTETEIVKDKSSASTVTVKDFWALLSESGLKGILSRNQFDLGMKPFVDSVKEAKETIGRVDYAALCHNIVRMGRAFNSILQEKKKVEDVIYKDIKAKLHSELKTSGALEKTGKLGNESFRFQKVMKRLDEDGDGQLSVAEFKIAMRRYCLISSLLT